MPEQEKKPRRRIKKVRGHGGHHGGAWKVAYADFVTAMMALFLVLWLVSQADTKLKSALANHFRAPGVFDTIQGGILGGPTKVSREPSQLTSKDEEQALYSTAAVLQKQFATRPEFSSHKDQIKIDVTDEGLRIQIVDKAERVSFSSGSATITPEARAVISEVARAICALPNPIRVGGHTDRHLFPPGSTYTNWELSADRANAARRELEASCVKSDQITRIIGYADTELFVPNDPYATANRRISIIVARTQPPPGQEEDSAGEKKKESKGDEPTKNSPADDDLKPGKVTEEKRLMKTKLATEGAVTIGEPDVLPANAQRTREPAPARPAPKEAPNGKGANRPAPAEGP